MPVWKEGETRCTLDFMRLWRELGKWLTEVDRAHDVFHISQLRKFVFDLTKIIQPAEVELDVSLEYEEYPVRVINAKEKVLRHKTIPMLKVLWSRHGAEDVTWKTEEHMKLKYTDLELTPLQ